ncbi:DNA-binding helix-turn-helix protein [Lentilactobacillus parafarraginis F0439]|uniref:DNA-binding helix-turn-helix protein n=1 Tax=Lentilactobacillus parafarraginis F0439 TaxID=797515 RepID=G9ZRQ0_9LACO|nr:MULTISPECIES: helix-turn-helix transcriptional regulator [Lentilactobacillus]EHL96268.1 DNA-binding helix-turn-helix protein [Lentilactobacillus parafarraginis F0439]MQM81544.1 helix-turn-helix transcriptional regulator [Lentilactobacillus buchneri]
MTQNRLKYWREKQRLTQTDLSVKSGVTQSTINSIEHGSDPRGDTIKKLSKGLGITADELLNMREVTK